MSTTTTACPVTKEFVLAGKAIFSVAPPAEFVEANDCPEHWTFRVDHKEAENGRPEAFFVSLLTGPDNSSDYRYLAMLGRNGCVRVTAKSLAQEGSLVVRVLRRVLARIWTRDQDAILESGWSLNHCGRCARCSRLLTTPESVDRGFGPECWALADF